MPSSRVGSIFLKKEHQDLQGSYSCVVFGVDHLYIQWSLDYSNKVNLRDFPYHSASFGLVLYNDPWYTSSVCRFKSHHSAADCHPEARRKSPQSLWLHLACSILARSSWLKRVGHPWMIGRHPRSLSTCHWKLMVGRLLSFWDGLFSGSMLNFQGVHVGCFCFLFKPCVFFTTFDSPEPKPSQTKHTVISCTPVATYLLFFQASRCHNNRHIRHRLFIIIPWECWGAKTFLTATFTEIVGLTNKLIKAISNWIYRPPGMPVTTRMALHNL